MVNTENVISEAIQRKIFNYVESHNLEPNLIELSPGGLSIKQLDLIG